MHVVSLILLGAACAYQLGWAWFASVGQIVGSVTNDDTFLYLEFARNTVAHGFPTFDGMYVTNGVQPLWAGILIVLATLTDDKIILMRGMLSICAMLNMATGLVLLRMAVRMQHRVLAGVVCVCWTWYMLGLKPSMLGMENSLHAFIASLVILQLACFLNRASPPSWRRYLVLGILLALNAGARLDSAVVSAVLGLALVHRGAALGSRRSISLLFVFGPGLLAAGAYCLLNYNYFGIILPVSGQMKSYYAQHYLPAADSWQWPWLVLAIVAKTFFAAPQWILAYSAPEGIESLWLGVALVLVITPLLLRFVAPRWVDRSAADGPLAGLCRLLLVATLAHMTILAINILHFSVDTWYHSWLVLTWILLLAWGLDRWLHSPVLRRNTQIGMVASIMLLLVATKGIAIHRQVTGREALPLYEARLDVAQWVDRNIPLDTKLAAWNAGQLAYFTDQPLVNLDGLMNSPEYASFIRDGGDVREKLNDLGIDIVVDYNFDDSSIPDHFSWDAAKSFRGLWSWDNVVVLHQRSWGEGKRFYVLRLREDAMSAGGLPMRRIAADPRLGDGIHRHWRE